MAMNINIEACIKNAANHIDEASGEHSFEEVKALSLLSIANSLLALVSMVYVMASEISVDDGREVSR